MAPRSSALRKSSTQRKSGTGKRFIAASTRSRPEKLPEWNLADLYSGIDAPEVARDLDRMDAECNAFEQEYKGRLAERTAKDNGGSWLPGAGESQESND